MRSPCGISERIAGPFFLFLLINSAFGYEFRKKRKKLQSASSGSARQKLYKVEVTCDLWVLILIFFLPTLTAK